MPIATYAIACDRQRPQSPEERRRRPEMFGRFANTSRRPLLTAAIVTVAAIAASGPITVRGEEPREKPARLHVMSFNIRYGSANDGANSWSARQTLVKTTITRFDPDVLGCQEVLDFQADALKKALPGYEFVGVGRTDGRREGEFSPIYFKRDRFELLASGTFWLSETPDRAGSKSWDSALPRIVTWARLRDRKADCKLLFCSTHFDHRGKQAREQSASLLRERVRQLADGAALVVAGDFNCTEDDAPYRALVADSPGDFAKLIDTYRSVHAQRAANEATFHNFLGEERGSRIDWILCSEEFGVRAAEIDRFQRDGRFPSDHFPVTAVLEWNAR